MASGHIENGEMIFVGINADDKDFANELVDEK